MPSEFFPVTATVTISGVAPYFSCRVSMISSALRSSVNDLRAAAELHEVAFGDVLLCAENELMPATSVDTAAPVMLSKARPLDLDIWRIPAIALLTRVEAKRTNCGGKRAKKQEGGGKRAKKQK